MSKDNLGNRMKEYEAITDYNIPKRMPVIIRLDGKAFHSWTKGLERPFCSQFINIMQETSAFIFKNVATCQLAYVQSDEISLLLNPYKKIESQPFFNNRLNKINSVVASMATYYFNKNHNIESKINKPAFFDCRTFILPEHEINNYFVWRQNDCSRNSIAAVAQAHFSHKELHKKKVSDMHDMLMLQKRINWNDCSTVEKRGTCIVKENIDGKSLIKIDTEIPIFAKNPEYVQNAFVFNIDKE